MKYLIVLMMIFAITGIHAQDRTTENKEMKMKRFIVERDFNEGLIIPVDERGSQACLNVVLTNSEDKVTWVHSYVSKDKKKTFCVYDAPSEEAIRRTAEKNCLPVNNITEVSVLDPYFYR